MAAGRRDAEGIVLLSVVYGDLDSDYDLEDAAASPPPLTTAIPGDGEAAGSSIVDYAHDEAAASPEHEGRSSLLAEMKVRQRQVWCKTVLTIL
jgi:hypothetical protein